MRAGIFVVPPGLRTFLAYLRHATLSIRGRWARSRGGARYASLPLATFFDPSGIERQRTIHDELKIA